MTDQIPAEAGHYQDEQGRHWLHQIHDGTSYGAPDRDTDQWLDWRGKIADPVGHTLTRLVPQRPEPSEDEREQVASLISNFLAPILGQSPGGPEQMDYDLADAVLALFKGGRQ